MPIKRIHSLFFGMLSFLCIQYAAHAQTGDNFQDAVEIPIPSQGYGTGNLVSPSVSFDQKTTEVNEYFPEDLVLAALIEKSVWFKFKIPTSRSVFVQLNGSGNLAQQDVGFAIYQNPGAFAGPHRLCEELPPLNKMGSVGNTCLPAGEYYIQVLARKRVTDSVYINLTVGKYNLAWSEISQAPLLNNFGSSVYSPKGECSYIPDSVVASMMPDSSYHHFFNWRFEAYAKFPKTTHSFQINGLVPSFYYVVKENFPAPVNQWQILDSGKITQAQNTLIWDCVQANSLAEGTYRILLFSQSPSIYRILINHQLQEQGSNYESNPQKLPPSQNLGEVKSSDYIQGTLSCNTPVYTNICPNLNEDLYTLNPQGDSVPLEFQTWFTFSVKEDCRLAINSYRINPQPDIASRLDIRIYEGSDLASCSIKRLYPDYGRVYCLKAGRNYTLRILAPNDHGVLDKQFRLQLAQTNYLNHPHKFVDSLYPEVINNAFASFPADTEGEDAYIEYREQQVFIGSDTLNVGAKFHEFYVPRSLEPFRITFSGYTFYTPSGSRVYLMRGRKSTGTATDLITSFQSWQDFPTGLDEGWYTLVHTVPPYPGECHDIGADQAFKLIFSPLAACNPGSVETSLENPLQIDPTAPLSFDQEIINGAIYKVPRTYKTQEICFTKKSIDTGYAGWLKQTCGISGDLYGLNYVEFELTEESEASIQVSGYNFWLISGSLRQDPAQRYMPSSYVQPCTKEGKFCRLRPGWYSLVIMGKIADHAPCDITIGPIEYQLNDYIENSTTLSFSQDTFRTTPFVMSCAYSADTSDMIAGHLLLSEYGDGIIDTSANVAMRGNRLMTSWYDLAIPGFGKLELRSRYGINVYEILDTLKWAQWKGNSQFRDSMAGILKLVAGKSELSSNVLKVYNGRCIRRHYAIVLERSSTFASYFGDLSGIWFPVQKTTPENDFCETAGELEITSFTGRSLILDPRCLTKGEGFGEDGKNMACLPLSIPYTTLWAKVHVDPGDVYDIYFSVGANYGGFNNNQIHYRILYGSCSALNPGPCVVNANTQIGFQCMQAGDYYIQIAVPEDMGNVFNLTNLVQVGVSVRTTADPVNCNAFDLTKPLASFVFEGQCTTDSVFFSNYSSQGNDISYFWDFGDGQTSTDKDPRVVLTTLLPQEDREIKLYVINNQNNKSDSFSRSIRLWKDPLSVQVPFEDTLVRCGTSLKISSSHTFADGIPLYSINGLDTLDGNTVDQRFTQNTSIRFIVWTAGCFIDKEVKVGMDNRFGIQPRDTLLCKEGVVEVNLQGWKSVEISPEVQGPIYSLKKTGAYRFTISDSGCVYRDTINIVSKSKVWNHSADSLICNGDSIQLSIDGNYQNMRWQDGSTAPSFWATQTGLYWVEGQWDECINRDSIWVSISDLSNPLILDADTQCLGYEWTLRSEKSGQNYIWSNGDQSRETRTQDTGWMHLFIDNGGCSVYDSMYLQYHEKDLDLGNDTVYCDFMDWVLDAGPGTAYAWWPNFSDKRYFQVPDSGLWGVWKIDLNGCEQEDTVYIQQSCGPYFQMPNAFSPNNDGINDMLRWVHVDIDEFELFIYNRWGILMHHTTSLDDFWNGEFRGVTAGDGVYVYIVKYAGTSSNGIREEGKESGTFILLRSDR